MPSDHVGPDAVTWAFRFFYGRDPVDEAEIRFHQGHSRTLDQLRDSFARSTEWQAFDLRAKSSTYAIPPFLLQGVLDDPALAERIVPSLRNPTSQLCTENQFAEPEYRLWCEMIRERPRLHRKQWEFVYILQVLAQAGVLLPGKAGIGFGTGREPIPSVLARFGVNVLATDAPADISADWAGSNQHAASIDALWRGDIISREAFNRHVHFGIVDMNAIPPELSGFDFCWSSCCLEHLGSIDAGLDYIENCLKVLKPGGIAVNTTEFNLSSNKDTLASGGTVIFRQQDMQRIAARMRVAGHDVYPFKFFPGLGPVDSHIDLPPYSADPHLKLALANYVSTSIGIVVRKVAG